MVDYVGEGARASGLDDDVVGKLVIESWIVQTDNYSRRNGIFLEQEDDQQRRGSSA